MKRLEDRIKDKLEGYESSLPEGDLAEFKALLDSSASAAPKRNPVYSAWLVPAVVAAGLALFFVLRHSRQADIAQETDNGPLVADVIERPEPPEDAPVIRTKPAVGEMENTKTKEEISERSSLEQTNAAQGEEEEWQDVGEKRQGGEEKHRGESSSIASEVYSPFLPSGSRAGKLSGMKVGPATAVVLGGTGALALASFFSPFLINGNRSKDAALEPIRDGRTNKDTHYMPLRVGLSIRFPFNDRWSLTTGLDYLWYASRLGYSLSGIHKQNAHYLSIPLRADFTIAGNRWMDVYVGAGTSLDFCVAAYDAGQKITRDGVGFSLIGAGGIQFNINRNLGLFLDPTLSWNIPSGERVLDTYKSEHPFMFTVSAGLRVTVPGRK